MLESVCQAWLSYASAVLPANASQEQIRQCRWAFYGGFHACHCQIALLGEPEVTETQGIEHLEALRIECERFKQDVLEGRA